MQLACLKSNDCISPLNKFQSLSHLEAGNKQLHILAIGTISDRQIASYCSQFMCPFYLLYENHLVKLRSENLPRGWLITTNRERFSVLMVAI